MEIFVFLLICAVIVLAVYVAKTRKQISQLHAAVSALVAEMRERGMDDVVGAAKQRAAGNAAETEPSDSEKGDDYVKIIREPALRTASSAPAKKAPDERVSQPIRTELETEGQPGTAYEEEVSAKSGSLSERIEDIGGKLPIWVGGISLIFGGFFLVRYGIEAGIFGPAIRVVMAAIFGIALIAASEAGRIWPVLEEDERLGQSLAGAGIAICYGTLYMAGELYGLIGAIPAFILLVIVTTGALLLSLKRGAPTAIMGLLGGFAAPYVAGLGPDSAGPLLIYLAIFTAGLFALSIHRGWLWLAMLASGGSVLWSSALMISGVGGASPILGIFIVGLAIGGMIALEKIAQDRPGRNSGLSSLLRLSPIAIGLLQLAIFAPLIEFTLMGWLFYGALSVFAIVIAWRDPLMTPAPLGALALALVMLASYYTDAGPVISEAGSRTVFAHDMASAIIAIAIAALFGIPGQLLAFRKQDGNLWSLLALFAPTGAFLALFLFRFEWMNGYDIPARYFGVLGWAMTALVAAVPAAILAWRAASIYTPEMDDAGLLWPASSRFVLQWSTIASSLLALVSIYQMSEYGPFFGKLATSLVLLVAIAMLFWRRHVGGRALQGLDMLPLALGLVTLLFSFAPFAEIFMSSLFGAKAHYDLLPAIGSITITLLLPAALLAAIWWLKQDERPEAVLSGTRNIFMRLPKNLPAIAAGIIVAAFAYLLLKQPFAIADEALFVRFGLLERTILTHILFGLGYAAFRWAGPDDAASDWRKLLRPLGYTMVAAAFFRTLWFDALLLNPLWEEQEVGAAPVANLLVLHPTLIAIWLALLARTYAWTKWRGLLRCGTLLFTMVAGFAAVRQLMWGSIVTGYNILQTENYLYSAVIVLLSIIWLWRGIATGSRLLRLAGLITLALAMVKVFLIDGRSLDGILRVLSFIGFGFAAVGIGWFYSRLMRRESRNE